MSKARQRRESLYSMGRKDALSGKFYRWKRHPNIADYHEGFMSVKKQKRFWPEWLMYILRLCSR